MPHLSHSANTYVSAETRRLTKGGTIRQLSITSGLLSLLQLFWEKRLEGLRACDPDGYEFDGMDLPKSLRPVGPYITEETLLQSVATALHVSTQPVTGQTGSKSSLEKNPGVYLNPDQPLVQVLFISGITSLYGCASYNWIVFTVEQGEITIGSRGNFLRDL